LDLWHFLLGIVKFCIILELQITEFTKNFSREKDEVTKEESEICDNYLKKHFKEGKFAEEGPASAALGTIMNSVAESIYFDATPATGQKIIRSGGTGPSSVLKKHSQKVLK
jgi:hypothetical protein